MVRTFLNRLMVPALAGLLLLPAACAQAEHPLTGRRIAGVMGMSGAEWLERSEREEEERPERLVEALKLRQGMVVADVGAGIGYITERLAKRVGPGGKVFATDIQPEMLLRLKKRMRKQGLENVVPVQSMEADPKLPDSQVDLALMVDVYHELSRPQEFLRNLRKALKPGGKLVLVEYRGEDPGIPIQPDHKMTVAVAKAEVESEGFRLAEVGKQLPRQHILVFTKTESEAASASRRY